MTQRFSSATTARVLVRSLGDLLGRAQAALERKQLPALTWPFCWLLFLAVVCPGDTYTRSTRNGFEQPCHGYLECGGEDLQGIEARGAETAFDGVVEVQADTQPLCRFLLRPVFVQPESTDGRTELFAKGWHLCQGSQNRPARDTTYMYALT